MAAPYLTKSRFKLAYECPTKLFYGQHPEYGDLREDNDFLQSLAQGGFQVGALAKVMYPGGIDLEELKADAAIARTSELLRRDNVIIFEAAIQAGPYLIRVDVLQKLGSVVEVIEVKAKSYDFPGSDRGFFSSRGRGLLSEWEPYLVDVAFQKWVTEKYFGPGVKIVPYLMLADTTAVASVDHLHQRFFIQPLPDGKSAISLAPGTTKEGCGNPLLRTIEVTEEAKFLIEEHRYPGGTRLPEYAKFLADHLASDEKAAPVFKPLCKTCEFRIGPDLKAAGRKSGFDECAIETGNLRTRGLNEPLIFDIWNFRKTAALLEQGRVRMAEVDETDLGIDPANPEEASSTAQRQWLQVSKVKRGDRSAEIDRGGLADLFDHVTWPLHCIDFETTTVAIPFHRGRRPYEQIAFQFSHHVLHENGRIAHAHQYIHTTPGEFPNYGFLRELRKALSHDQGTIFRFAPHENTVLRQILGQLEATPTEDLPPDTEELAEFIVSITRPRDSERITAAPPPRLMKDLRQVVLEHYYHPLMGGSNSIKKVIPAVLHDSRTLRAKYSRPIYGKGAEIPSLNFAPMAWIQTDAAGQVRDPYSLLPPMWSDSERLELRSRPPLTLVDDGDIDDGGAAMTAWARLQFTQMSEPERAAVRDALLRYCELDTLSMVWILEYFRELAQQ